MAQHCCNNLESRMAQQFCSIHTPVMSQYGQNLLDISLLYTNADKARLQHRPFWLNHNLSSNLLVHDLHCTSCAVSPTSSYLFKPPCSWPSLYQLCSVTYQFIFAQTSLFMTFIVPATLVQTSLFTTFTVPAVWCHPLVHLCSNLLVHDLHCISNLSSNLLVHDLHCTSCAVSPTSSYLFKPPCSWPSLYQTFTVPAVQCHLPVHICSNLLVHDLHCTSNLSSNLLVHDLHCTSCAVSPTSSYLFKPPCSWPSLYQQP